MIDRSPIFFYLDVRFENLMHLVYSRLSVKMLKIELLHHIVMHILCSILLTFL